MRPDWRKPGMVYRETMTREQAIARLAGELMADIETLRTSLPKTRTVALALAIIIEIAEEDKTFPLPQWLWQEAALRGYFVKEECAP